MMRKYFIIVWVYLIGFNSVATFGYEKLKLDPEISEWGLTAAVFAVAQYLDKTPTWVKEPLLGGATNKPFRENTISSGTLYAMSGATALGVALLPCDEGWLTRPNYQHTKGLIETLSLTFLLTNITKNSVGRRRPSFDNWPQDDLTDADKSFFSGHTSIACALATYSSMYVTDHIGSKSNGLERAGQLSFILVSHFLAGYVGYSRVIDNQHFVSDVITGGLIGSALAAVVYSLQEENLKASEQKQHSSLSKSPVKFVIVIPL
jgi:membrane-associated phospholipid phosphatase